jgi:hypothetical protein
LPLCRFSKRFNVSVRRDSACGYPHSDCGRESAAGGLTPMIFISYLLSAALALVLALLGGGTLGQLAPGRSADRSAFARNQDRLLGFALCLTSLIVAGVSAGKIASHLAADSGPGPLAVTIWVFLGLIWLGAVVVGMRRPLAVHSGRLAAFVAVVLLILLIATTDGRIARTDGFLLLGLMVWLATTLMTSRRAVK